MTKSTILRKALLGVKPKSSLNMTHTLSISHKKRKILRAKFARVEKRASVPAARVTAKLL
jgi:hypothetical protein